MLASLLAANGSTQRQRDVAGGRRGEGTASSKASGLFAASALLAESALFERGGKGGGGCSGLDFGVAREYTVIALLGLTQLQI